VNWSAAYIKGVLSKEEISTVIANEINPKDGSINATPSTPTGVASVEWPDVLTVGLDKLSALRCLQRQQRKNEPERSLGLVYFGDSTTDIECLLEFGGVVISSNPNMEKRPSTRTASSHKMLVKGSDLLHMLQTMLNYNVPHVSLYEGEPICWARDFAEVIQSSHLRKRVAIMRATKT
jgi:thiamine phosphate phosphatase / amino-HMP aminohydrolase